MKRMLIVNDELDTARSFSDLFSNEGWTVDVAANKAQAYVALKKVRPHLVLLDMDLVGREEDCSGITILEYIRSKWSRQVLPVIILSRYLDSDKIERLIKIGIQEDDYFPLPVVNLRRIIQHVQAYDPERTIPAEHLTMAPTNKEELPYFRSPSSIELKKKLTQLAGARKDIVLVGEPSTGKTHLAKYFHTLVKEKNRSTHDVPWVRISCATLTEALFEGTIFGQEPGCGEGIHTKSRGLIEAGQHGVIFFDDVSVLPKSLQIKMLDLLATKKYRRIGSDKIRELDCVFVIALEHNVAEQDMNNMFMRRLQRFSTVPLAPLRERKAEIKGLAEQFIRRFNQKYGRQVLGIQVAAVEALQQQAFLNNVGDLETIIEESVLGCRGSVLSAEDVCETLGNQNKIDDGIQTEKGISETESGCYQGRGELRYRELKLISKKHEAYLAGQRLDLRLMEFNLLELFISRVGYVLTRTEIIEHLRPNSPAVVADNTINTHVKHLRDKLGEHGKYILSIRGVGYKLLE